MKRKTRILVVAPYDGLEHLFQIHARERDDVYIKTVLGDMLEGQEKVKQEDLSQFDVIISRAGTADLIRKITELPVIDIKISILDMMRAIKLAENYSGDFAIVGFKSITEQAMLIKQLIHHNLNIRTVSDMPEINVCLNELKEAGISMIVGDMITTKHAKRFGLNTILVTSGVESVRNAISEAVQIHEYVMESRNKLAFVRHVHDQLDIKVVSFGEDGEVVYANLEGQDQARELIRVLSRLSRVLANERHLRVIKTIGENQYVIEGKWLSFEGAHHPTFYLKKQPAAWQANDKAIVFKNAGDFPQVKFEAFPTANPEFRQLIAVAKAYSGSDAPILICGDKGSGKNMLAHAIYQNGPLRNSPMIVIDSKYMNEAGWTSLLESEQSPFLNEGYTIYVRNIHFLNEKIQRMLETYLSHTRIHKRNRFIFSCINGFANGSLVRFIRSEMNAFTLMVPNLNQRKEDVPSFVSLFLSELNPKYGKQVLGLQPDALELLQNFPWTYHVEQLKKVMEELMMLADDYFIGAETVQRVLANERFPQADSGASVIDLSKTLEEINQDIIEYVLTQENFNYSKAAKRLGISRSTLWRKMK
jgi:transcriptional regulator with PAS, ATPase and Fis domain